MNKGLIFTAICALFGSAETQATSWIENAVAGTYFHNVSVGESGAASSETWDMIKSKFSTNHDFEYNEIEVNDFIFPYYVKKSEGDVLDFLMQGIMEKDSGWAFNHSFDEKINIRGDALMRETSLEFFSKLAKIYENKTLQCHMSTAISASREEEKGLGKIYGHVNYAQVTIKNGNMDLFLCEPCQLEQSGQHYAAYQMRFSWNNNPVNVTHTHRGDQRLNSKDCALFSFIYLMYAIEGRDVSKLSNVDIYNGFTRWIEGEKNLLSLKKMSQQKEAELMSVFLDSGKNFSIIFDPSFSIDYSEELLNHANTLTTDFLRKNQLTLFDDYFLRLEKEKSKEIALKLYNKKPELDMEILKELAACIKQKSKELLLYKGIASRQQLVELRNNMPAISNIYGSTFTKMRRTIIDITLSAIRQTNAFVTSLSSIFYLKIS